MNDFHHDSGWKTIGDDQYRTAGGHSYKLAIFVDNTHPNYLQVQLSILLHSGYQILSAKQGQFYYPGRDRYDATTWAQWSSGQPQRSEVQARLTAELKQHTELFVALNLRTSIAVMLCCLRNSSSVTSEIT